MTIPVAAFLHEFSDPAIRKICRTKKGAAGVEYGMRTARLLIEIADFVSLYIGATTQRQTDQLLVFTLPVVAVVAVRVQTTPL